MRDEGKGNGERDGDTKDVKEDCNWIWVFGSRSGLGASSTTGTSSDRMLSGLGGFWDMKLCTLRREGRRRFVRNGEVQF
jgi:hypothetical protein